ncbi:MAG: CHASE2 domain-containing protein [Burkholderiales bacterium]|nr:CHASE2 domain-containing protein [Burkholderiales bacterium]
MKLRRSLLALVLAACAAALGALQGLGHADLAASDLLRFPAAPASPGIVIVGIDDASVARLGRWPWPRLRHAELIEQLALHQPRAIGLDILLSEAASRDEDAVLADVMRRSGRVVLPVSSQPDGRDLRPLPVFERSAAATGRVDIDVDDDGLVRGVYLGTRDPAHFVLAMARVGNERFEPQPWQSREVSLLDFREPDAGFLQVSFADVLDGKAPAGRIRDAYVFVGMTATGLGDAYPTPALPSRGLRPGVDILATALEAHVAQRAVRRAPAAWNALANAVAVLVACVLLVRLRADRAWLALLGSLLAFALVVALLRQHARQQVLPLAGALGIAAAYLAWSTSWLRKTIAYVFGEIRRLRAAGYGPAKPGDLDFDSSLLELREQSEAMLQAKDTLEQSLEQLPECTFVVDAERRLLLANSMARATCRVPLQGVAPRFSDVLAARLRRADAGPLDEVLADRTTMQEVVDAEGARFLLRSVPRAQAAGRPIGWVVTLVAATGLGDEALGFLSHDMRAPQASILSLLQLHRAGALQQTEAELLDRIGRLAETTLGYADDFIQLARAESTAYDKAPLLVLDIVRDVADELWARARAAGVTIAVEGDEAWCEGDRMLLHRAFQNLVDNAVKFAPAGSSVDCRVAAGDGRVMVSVRDHGRGFGAEAPHLFQPFAQHEGARTGVGLGLAMVRTVVVRHGGDIEAANADGGGALFRLWLPSGAPPPEV